MKYTELPRATSLAIDYPRIVADNEEVITGDKLTVCLVWNNLTGQNFKNREHYRMYYRMLLDQKRISSTATKFALFDGMTLLHIFTIPDHVKS